MRLSDRTEKFLVFSFDILLSLKGADSYGAECWSGLFGGFLLHRSALPRRISTGFTSGLPGPRSFGRREFRMEKKEKQTLYPRPEGRALRPHLVSGLT